MGRVPWDCVNSNINVTFQPFGSGSRGEGWVCHLDQVAKNYNPPEKLVFSPKDGHLCITSSYMWYLEETFLNDGAPRTDTSLESTAPETDLRSLPNPP